MSDSQTPSPDPDSGSDFSGDGSSLTSGRDLIVINRVCNVFEKAVVAGDPVSLEEAVGELEERLQGDAFAELAAIEAEYRVRRGQDVTPGNYTGRLPAADDNTVIQMVIAAIDAGHHATSRNVPDDNAPRAEPKPIDVSASAQRTLGQYDLHEKIGSGGMGEVYRAVHRSMNREVAVKLLRSDLQQTEILAKRFQREVRAAAKLSHPNIVTAFDAGEQDGLMYLVTELVNGYDLSVLVKAAGPMPPAIAVDVVSQCALGLAFAHSKGIIHRDIKPGNLLVDRDGAIKILDMGLARFNADVDDSAVEMDLTHTGTMVGTAAYMSPEQAQDTRHADERSDLYSLGCVLHYLMSGKRLFQRSSSLDTIIAHQQTLRPALSVSANHTPAVSPELSTRLDGIFARMVARDPAQRFESVQKCLDELQIVGNHFASQEPRADLADWVAHAVTAIKSRPFVRSACGPDATTSAPLTATTQGDLSMSIDVTGKAADATSAKAQQIHADPARKFMRWMVALGLVVIAVTVTAGSLGMFESDPADVIPGAPVFDQHASDQGLRFDGESQFVSIDPDFRDRRGVVTLEAIVTPDRMQISNVISWTGENWMALFMDDAGRWGITRRNGTTSVLVRSNQPASLGVVTHVAGTWDGRELQLYVDGQSVKTWTFDYNLGETLPGLSIGGVDRGIVQRGHESRFFAGTIAGFRITDGLRYRGEFAVPDHLDVDDSTIVAFDFGQRIRQAAEGVPVPASLQSGVTATRGVVRLRGNAAE